MKPAVCKELNLTPEQRHKLRDIGYNDSTAWSKYAGEAIKAKKLPQDKIPAAYTQWRRERRAEIEKQVEGVLTPGQMQSLKDLTFQEDAYHWLHDPNRLEKLNLTKEQKDGIVLLRQEFRDWVQNRNQEDADKTLSVLSPQQQARLREEALGTLGPDDQLQQLAVHVKGETKPIFVYALAPYPDFTRASVRKQLGLSAAQEQQVRDILGGSTNLAQRLSREVEKLSPQERKKLSYGGIASVASGSIVYSLEELAKLEEKQIEERKKRRAGFADQPMMRPSIALRKQFEAVLTPKQLALYRDLAVRDFAGDVMNDRLMLRMIGASEQQKAELKRISDDSFAKSDRHWREMGQKGLKILTAAQQEALRADFEAEITRIEETVSGSPDSAAEGASGGTFVLGGAMIFTGSNASAPSAKPAPGANDRKVSAGPVAAPTASVAMEKWDPSFYLPAYLDLCQPDQRRTLGIELSGEQLKKLREISTDWHREFQELSKDNPKQTDQQEWAKYLPKFRAKISELVKAYRKQIEAVLTPQQLHTYQEVTLNQEASRVVHQPEACKIVGITITREQQEKLDQVNREFSEKNTEKIERVIRVALAVLSPQQREQLRPVVEQRNLADDEWHWWLACQTEPVEVVSEGGLHFNAAAGPAKDANMVHEQHELQYKPIADKLGLSDIQQKQLSALDAEHQRETEKLLAEVLKLSPEQRKRPEVREKAARMRDETRRRIAALLTPQQLAALKEIDFGQMAMRALMEIVFPEMAFDKVTAPEVQKKIALDDQQTATLRGIHQDFEIDENRIIQELDRKSFDVLTAQQQDKIRESLVKRRGW